MIKVEHVSFTYENAENGAAILDNSAQISKGEIVLLCGESGSGKTTFSRLINGLIPNYYEGTLVGFQKSLNFMNWLLILVLCFRILKHNSIPW